MRGFQSFSFRVVFHLQSFSGNVTGNCGRSAEMLCAKDKKVSTRQTNRFCTTSSGGRCQGKARLLRFYNDVPMDRLDFLAGKPEKLLRFNIFLIIRQAGFTSDANANVCHLATCFDHCKTLRYYKS